MGAQASSLKIWESGQVKVMKNKKLEVYPETGHLWGIPCYGQFVCEYCGIQSAVQIHLDFLLGKVLTAIDASITEPEQRKAVKDIVKGYTYLQFEKLERDVMSTVNNCTDHALKEGLSNGQTEKHQS